MTLRATLSRRADQEIDTLLNETLADCHDREANTFDIKKADSSGIVLFGAGGLGRRVLAALRESGTEPLVFADNKLAGRVVDGVSVVSPAEAASRYGRFATFIVTIWASWADTMQEQVSSLQAQGCKTVVPFIPLIWKYPYLLPHVQVDLPSRVLEQKEDVFRSFELFSDEYSRREFVAQLRWRLCGDFESLNSPLPDQYFQRDLLKFKSDMRFCDAGAFDGDTIAQFLSFTHGRFRSAHAFEPDPQNLQALQRRVAGMPEDIRSRIQIHPCAVGKRECRIPFEGGCGVSSKVGDGQDTVDTVRCVALDTVLLEPPDFIKYDIEGFELDGLSGSHRIIEGRAPGLAVCAYHVQDHLWRIPLLINAFNRHYRFYLRPHGQIWETVCYAIPELELD